MIAEVERVLSGYVWLPPQKVVRGTVTIIPFPTPGGYQFELSGHGAEWQAHRVDGEWRLDLDGSDEGSILYQMTFQFPQETGFSFNTTAAQLSQAAQGACIVQEVVPGAASMLLSFVNGLTKEEPNVEYAVGFSFQAPDGKTVIWDPTIVLNPPG